MVELRGVKSNQSQDTGGMSSYPFYTTQLHHAAMQPLAVLSWEKNAVTLTDF